MKQRSAPDAVADVEGQPTVKESTMKKRTYLAVLATTLAAILFAAPAHGAGGGPDACTPYTYPMPQDQRAEWWNPAGVHHLRVVHTTERCVQPIAVQPAWVTYKDEWKTLPSDRGCKFYSRHQRVGEATWGHWVFLGRYAPC